eukprot:scaffold459_cov117-Isochrysis_galbana.AAC.27
MSPAVSAHHTRHEGATADDKHVIRLVALAEKHLPEVGTGERGGLETQVEREKASHTLARGSDPSLAKGSDPSLAKGSDPSRAVPAGGAAHEATGWAHLAGRELAGRIVGGH